MSKQIEALKLALECIEAWDRGCDRDHYWRDIEAATNAIREALAEQKSGIKQVIELYDSSEQPAQHQPNIESYLEKDNLQPAQQQVPSIIQMLGHCPECGAKAHHFTSPQPSKPWVGLTEFDIDQIPYSCSHADSRLIAYAIEAKLREKNAQPSKPLTHESIAPVRRFLADRGIYLSDETTKALIEAAHGITGETK